MDVPQPFLIMRLAFTFKKKNAHLTKMVHLMTLLGVFTSCAQIASLFFVPQVMDRISLLPITLQNIYMTISWISLMYLMDIEGITKMNQEFCWPLNSAGTKVLKNILQTARFEDLKALVAVLMLLANIWYYLLDAGKVRQLDYVSALLRDNLPHLEKAYVAVVIGWAIIVSPVILCFPFTFYYSQWLQQFQTLLFASYVRDVLGADLERRLADEDYQQIVWERLKFAVKRHNEILRTFRCRMEFLSIKLTTLLYGLSGGLIAISCCFNIVTGQRIVMSSLLLGLVIVLLEMMSSSIQSYEDWHEAIFNAALTVPWHVWNVRNRRAYLLMTQLSAQLVFYKFLNVRVNRGFQVKFMQQVYAAGTILIKLN